MPLVTDHHADHEASPAPAPARAEDPALLEEVRSLRLWANSLEAQLARRTEQVEVWRARAEERKDRIQELTERLDRPVPLRARLRAAFRSGPAGPPPAAPPSPGPGTRGTASTVARAGTVGRSDRSAPVVHPTVRAAVMDLGGGIPSIVSRLDHVVVVEAGDDTALQSSDILVIVTEDGAETEHGSLGAAATWITEGHPSVSIGGHVAGVPSLGREDLSVFEEADDVFGAPRGESGLDPDSFPTLDRVWAGRDGSSLGGFSLPLPPWTGDVERSHDLWSLERRAVAALRQLRRTRSPTAIGAMLLAAGGVTVPGPEREALAVLLSNRADLVGAAARSIAAQGYRPLRVAVGLHGPGAEAEQLVRSVLDAAGLPHVVAVFDESMSAGRCLNELVSTSPGDVVLKIDDDDLYSESYIEDSMLLLDYAGTDVVGKSSAFVRLADGEHLLLAGDSYGPTRFVYGPTIVMRRSVWDRVRFPDRHRRIDSKLMWGIHNAGLEVMATHPFDLCIVRHGRGHTWTAADDYFRSLGRTVHLDWSQMTSAEDADLR